MLRIWTNLAAYFLRYKYYKICAVKPRFLIWESCRRARVAKQTNKDVTNVYVIIEEKTDDGVYRKTMSFCSTLVRRKKSAESCWKNIGTVQRRAGPTIRIDAVVSADRLHGDGHRQTTCDSHEQVQHLWSTCSKPGKCSRNPPKCVSSRHETGVAKTSVQWIIQRIETDLIRNCDALRSEEHMLCMTEANRTKRLVCA